MDGNYVRSLFTIETSHGMGSSLSAESICDRQCVFYCVNMCHIFMCVQSTLESWLEHRSYGNSTL